MHPSDSQYFKDTGEKRHYALLGIHEEPTGQVRENGQPEVKKVARVRMFIDGKTEPVDEDFPYPEDITPEQQLEPVILSRVEELGAQNV